MKATRGLVSACALALLTACATAPPAPAPVPVSPVLTGVIDRLEEPPEALPAAPDLKPPAAPTPSAPPDLWARLRASFAMADCDSDPAILARAHVITRHPQVFERHLRAATPMIDYVQDVAARQHVAGEFVLLPWVESHYRTTRSTGNRPAGIWQIMPITARSLHLPITRGYDARLDRIAATDAVMRLLTHYQQRWHDWRLVDLAYNSGESRIARWVKAHGAPPARPVIPGSSLRHSVRRHLIKLLAMACVIRQPRRFQVTLPALPAAERLLDVRLQRPLRIDQAARMSGMALSAWRRLNAAYDGTRMPRSAPLHMLLPQAHAQAFQRALATLRQASNGQRTTGTTGVASTPEGSQPHTYAVESGDSLWSIARRFTLEIAQLRLWNGLKAGDVLLPGQVLLLSAPD
jgi:membrane-bound lytic murein transglycosylase D